MSVSRQQYEAALSRVELYSLSCSHSKSTPSDSWEADLLEDYGEADFEADKALVAAFEANLPAWQRRALIESKGRRTLQRRRERNLGP